MQESYPHISIVIVNYNSADYLMHCLSSIKAASSNLRVEIVVIDNNSTDDDLQNVIEQFEYVKFILLPENLGFGKANNLGAEKASGEYILILNPDTILEEHTLDVMYNYMKEHPEVGISGCKVLNSDGSFQLACRRGFPTPWVSFTKLFGLQSLFPKSKLFARYNQTFRSIDETYYIDSVIGAFMFIRKDVWDNVGGFDEAFFMYGEDIDLCYRVQKTGLKISYVHTTSIIHHKGVSTRRSSINELKHFYEAMMIFSRKHFNNSKFFLFFLKVGILIRQFIALLQKYSRQTFVILTDLLVINLSLLVATKIRFEGFLNFPDYAYPTVFIAISLVLLISMVAVGEYFEGRESIRKAFPGLLVAFFILSSLTYFFKDFAFSRGVVLMTIGFGLIFIGIFRIVLSLYDKMKGKQSEKNIAILGIDDNAVKLFHAFQQSNYINTNIVGFISPYQSLATKVTLPKSVIGSVDDLSVLAEQYFIKEIIITDRDFKSERLFKILESSSIQNIKFHFAREFDDFICSRIIQDVSRTGIPIEIYNLSKAKNLILKRSIDLFFSLMILCLFLPFVYLFSKNANKIIKNLFLVIRGKKSIVGLLIIENEKCCCGKEGLLGLAHLSNNSNLTAEAIRKLNDYYLKNYTITLDLEIILKYILRKTSGK